MPKSQNRSGNYGFVTFCHECSIPYAMNVLEGTCLYGQRLVMKPRKAINSNEAFDVEAASRDDFIRGVNFYNGTNDSTHHNTLTNAYNPISYVDKRMLPGMDYDQTNSRTNYESFTSANDRLKSTVNPVPGASALDIQAYMNLGQQMFGANTFQLPMFNLIQNSYYGTPLHQQRDDRNNKRDSYNSPSNNKRDSYLSPSNNYRSHYRSNHQRGYDRDRHYKRH